MGTLKYVCSSPFLQFSGGSLTLANLVQILNKHLRASAGKSGKQKSAEKNSDSKSSSEEEDDDLDWESEFKDKFNAEDEN